MLKKISHIILALLVLVTTIGMTVSAHYCGGELKSVQVVTESESCCGDSCDSCHNEIIKVEVEDDCTFSSYSLDLRFEFSLLPALIQRYQFAIFTNEVVEVAYHKPPPLKIQTVLSDLQVYRL